MNHPLVSCHNHAQEVVDLLDKLGVKKNDGPKIDPSDDFVPPTTPGPMNMWAQRQDMDVVIQHSCRGLAANSLSKNAIRISTIHSNHRTNGSQLL